MCSAIITRNIFIVNAVHTVTYRDLLLPPGSTKMCHVTTTDGLVLWYLVFEYSCIRIFHELLINFEWIHMYEFAWKCINFAWTRVNFVWTRVNLHENTWKLIKISGFAVDIWAMWPVSEIGPLIFVASVWQPYYFTQNMWSLFTSIIMYIHCSIYLYAPAPSLKKCNFCYDCRFCLVCESPAWGCSFY